MVQKIKGFPGYGISAVVKMGGSLMRDPAVCREAIAGIERAARDGHRLLIVPGGGVPDKAIEAIDATRPLSPFTAHHACALAQDQTGYMLADPAFSTLLTACDTLGTCRTTLKEGRIPVLLPSRILFAMDPVEWSWDITSDAIAAWIAWVTGTPRLAILTDVDGVYRGAATSDPAARIDRISASDLATLGHTSIDACASAFMAAKGLSGIVMNGAAPDRLQDWLDGREVLATRITSTAQPEPVQ